jgi:predicted esterase
MGATADGTKELVAVVDGHRESELSWKEVLLSLKARGLMHAPELASPVNHVKKGMKPLCILHSDNDRSVPIENALMMVEALKKSEATHAFHRYPDKGHMGITEEVIARAREFIEEQSASQ